MSVIRFCRGCGKKTNHDKRVDIHGQGSWSGAGERLLLGIATMGASEAFAERYLECEECGKVTGA